MIADSSIREQGYIYFLAEAPELLQQIEQELFSLSTDFSTAKVHTLMRATHTIKGGAANIGLEVINKVAHYLEDIVKCLYNPDVIVDAQLQTLLVEAYECLRLPLTAELTGTSIDEEEILQRAATVFAKLQEKLGDAFEDNTHIPTSAELGFDIVQSIFGTGVTQRLETIAAALQSTTDVMEMAGLLYSQAEVFVGLGESLNLPGFSQIAETTIKALETNTQEVFKIGELALADLQQARDAVLGGDRFQGGAPSAALQKFTTSIIDIDIDVDAKTLQPIFSTTLNAELQELYKFLTQNFQVKGQCLKSKTAKLYLQIVHYLLGWFKHKLHIPTSDLNLSLLVPQLPNLSTHDSLKDWLQQFWQFISEPEDSHSLILYRQGVVLTILLAVARFQAHKGATNTAILEELTRQIQAVAQEYKQYPPVTSQEKQWFKSQKLKLLVKDSQEIISTKPPLITDNFREKSWKEQEPSTNLNAEQFSTKISETPEIVDTQTLVTAESTVALNNNSTPKSPSVSSASPRQKTFVRVDVEELKRLDYLVGELLVYEQRRSLQNEQLKDTLTVLSQQLHRHLGTLHLHQDVSKFDFRERRVESDAAVEETLQLQETADSLNAMLQQSQQMHEKQQRLVLNIIDRLVNARMLPLEQIVHRFPQMLQHLSQVYSKHVELKLTGTEVLVDKAIAEKLYDPLVQLLRNAFDHGIEQPEVRRQQGKPEQGAIEVCAYHRGSQTVIEVRDDGQGLNLEKIHAKAIQLGLLNADNTHPTPDRLLEFLFAPGFSTTDKVSEISGRGMGLDIVRSQLQALNGTVTVQSLPEQGTTFILTIPFSMTTEKLMLVQAGGVTYALLLDSIEKILIPTPEQIKVFDGKHVLYLQIGKDECMVNLQQMADLMPYTGCNYHHTPNTQSPVLLLRCQQGIVALVVDQIIGEQELVIRPLGGAIAPPKYIYGCTNLANGKLILVIDGTLLTQAQQMQAQLEYMRLPAANVGQQKNYLQPSAVTEKSVPLLTPAITPSSVLPTQAATKVVMVVDDSLSFRQTLSLILQKFGYQVLQAQNGLEALKQLQQHPEIQLVISDLEMPSMNGLEFLSRLHQYPHFAHKPVVILTSRSVQTYRQMAQHLGAAAYLTKPYVEQELVSTVERCLGTNELPKLIHS
jgi:chemotaxis family two-component system sensor histidine kinase/response regulator PixL